MVESNNERIKSRAHTTPRAIAHLLGKEELP
jgi:hypothetical protein